jgi:hypothetical protein
MMQSFVELDATGVRKDLSWAGVSYASNQYFNNISLSKILTHLIHTRCLIPTHISSPHLISLSHRHGRLPLAHVSMAKVGTPH